MILPDWPRPQSIRACVTHADEFNELKQPFGFNLGLNCGDDESRVRRRRRQLADHLRLSASPAWLDQRHGTTVAYAPEAAAVRAADASWSDQAGIACVVLTADCLPILICDDRSSVVAAVHAGWRGLAAGIVEATVAALPVAAHRLSAWIGPAIGPDAFEVGAEVRDAFVSADAGSADAFVPGQRCGHWQADLFVLAQRRLRSAGLEAVHGGNHCTHSDPRLFSYRRNRNCGRFASLIWRCAD